MKNNQEVAPWTYDLLLQCSFLSKRYKTLHYYEKYVETCKQQKHQIITYHVYTWSSFDGKAVLEYSSNLFYK